ncbi:hypothetical protein B0H13DRAFT_931929 [Mycena leptocephala]|nr:hypothetical protein B0H13DRAFT_931929 [Mycena leptocephala]
MRGRSRMRVEQSAGGRQSQRRRRKDKYIHPEVLPPSHFLALHRLLSSSLSSLCLRFPFLSLLPFPSLDAGFKHSVPGSCGLGFAVWGLGVPGCEAEPLCCPLAQPFTEAKSLAGAEGLGVEGAPLEGVMRGDGSGRGFGRAAKRRVSIDVGDTYASEKKR